MDIPNLCNVAHRRHRPSWPHSVPGRLPRSFDLLPLVCRYPIQPRERPNTLTMAYKDAGSSNSRQTVFVICQCTSKISIYRIYIIIECTYICLRYANSSSYTVNSVWICLNAISMLTQQLLLTSFDNIECLFKPLPNESGLLYDGEEPMVLRKKTSVGRIVDASGTCVKMIRKLQVAILQTVYKLSLKLWPYAVINLLGLISYLHTCKSSSDNGNTHNMRIHVLFSS